MSANKRSCQCAINHTIPLGTTCLRSTSGNGIADSPVWPATGNAIGCTFVDVNRPLNGNLFWIDSGYSCSTLPAWQRPVCVALQTYGGYIHVTGSGPLFVMPIEGGIAHSAANQTDPYFNEPNLTGTTAWIIANSPGVSCPSGGNPRICGLTNGIEFV
jgi:hypothetical protein